LAASVVFPVPPFCCATVITSAMPGDSRPQIEQQTRSAVALLGCGNAATPNNV
jgi:hypothetical protein